METPVLYAEEAATRFRQMALEKDKIALHNRR
jgi:hypothetical protein